ncbi:hypothetical protein F2Q68_00031255 [Brassica cretica]|uniref:Uncharacterized protein n=1 Tax=Brassica cretica TaxID=69181 RepID=A0A8S9G6Q7_BRACR|nr:hypothetical protein F2Q68_00031255 [Brassica cretica]
MIRTCPDSSNPSRSSFSQKLMKSFPIEVLFLTICPVHTDAPQYVDQSVERTQHDDQNVPNDSTEVHDLDRTGRTDRAVYRIDPRASGRELRLDPRPDDRSDRTEVRLLRPTRQVKTNDRARIQSERTDSESDQSFSFLTRLACTACTTERIDELSDHFNPIVQFDLQDFSKARILKFSEYLGYIWDKSVREEIPSGRVDCPARVLLLTAGREAMIL